jgi:NAD(P)-dependent dehydrogenase (short-subunit alcohol dehydrogenase family)
VISFQKEQVFIVTGASSGIGREVALLLNALGATVVAIARREDRLQDAKNQALHTENFLVEVKDLTEDFDGLPKYVTLLKEKYGKFHGMAYCAGVSENMPLKGFSFDDAERMFKINYYSPLFMVKGLVDKRNNVGKGTSVLAISSIASRTCPPGLSVYAGTKAALSASMRVIAREVSPLGVRVNTVAPALIETEMLDGVARAHWKDEYPFGFGQPDDVANFVVFMLSEKSKWINGRDDVIDCGSL